MYIPAAGLVTTYLFTRLAGTALILLIVIAIACPMIWSRDTARRARARDALSLLISLLTSRQGR